MPVGNVTVPPGDSPRPHTMISHVCGRVVGNSRNTTGRRSWRIQQLLHRVAEKRTANIGGLFWDTVLCRVRPVARRASECQRPFSSLTGRKRTGSEFKNIVPKLSEIVPVSGCYERFLQPLMPRKSKIVPYVLQSFVTLWTIDGRVTEWWRTHIEWQGLSDHNVSGSLNAYFKHYAVMYTVCDEITPSQDFPQFLTYASFGFYPIFQNYFSAPTFSASPICHSPSADRTTSSSQ